MTEGELSQAVNGLREQLTDLGQRVTKLEIQTHSLLEESREMRAARRQILMAIFGVGAANLVGLLMTLIKLLPP